MRSPGIASEENCDHPALALVRTFMKILLINDYGAPFGGAEALTFALRDALRRQGHDARLFASCAGTASDSQADYLCLGTLSRFRTLLQVVNPWAYVRLRRVLREFQPDVVHVRMFLTQLSPLILPLLWKIPALYHVVWYRPVCHTGTKLLPNRSLCQDQAGLACYRNGCVPLRDWGCLQVQMWLWKRWRAVFNRIVANSSAVQEYLLADGLIPVEVIYNGVVVAPAVQLWASRPLAVFAGRLVPEKGVDVLLRAFAVVARRLPEARLLIAGEGPERAPLVALAEALSLTEQVSFLGRLPKEQLESRFARAWVQVVPARWAEPFGLVAVEAMMRGTAVVASGTGGLQEIVDHGKTGYLVPPDDPCALAEQLTEVLSDETKARAMGCAGRHLAQERFSLNGQCEQFVFLYQQMLLGKVGSLSSPSTSWSKGLGGALP
jgi:glycosyltransferase involved in cell wall biosynthesis